MNEISNCFVMSMCSDLSLLRTVDLDEKIIIINSSCLWNSQADVAIQ